MEFKCNSCDRNFTSEESLNQHNSMKHASNKNEKAQINFKKYFIWSSIILIVVLISLSINAQMQKPREFDDL